MYVIPNTNIYSDILFKFSQKISGRAASITDKLPLLQFTYESYTFKK